MRRLLPYLARIVARVGVHLDGNSATYTHDVGDFAEAMLQAKDMCGSFQNKGIKHESTSCSPNQG